MSEIRSDFPDDLKSAGLFGLPFSWGSDGTFTFDPTMKQEDVDKVMTVYASHKAAESPEPVPAA